jgi:hypothetical protein
MIGRRAIAICIAACMDSPGRDRRDKVLKFIAASESETASYPDKYEDLRSVVDQMGRSEVTISDRLR